MVSTSEIGARTVVSRLCLHQLAVTQACQVVEIISNGIEALGMISKTILNPLLTINSSVLSMQATSPLGQEPNVLLQNT